ncbi:RNA polymerase sigma factor [Bryocella elongata]|nr:RNA polymerase sigma factor [Bryocella elongata]
MALAQTGEKTFAELGWSGLGSDPIPPSAATPTQVPLGAGILSSAEALTQSQRGRVFRFLFYSLREREVAEELTQDVLLSAWRARESFRGDSSPETWVMRIAVNALRNHTRTGRFKFWGRTGKVEIGELLTPPPDPARSAEQSLLAEERLRAVWSAAESLSERQRSVFLLHFVEDMEAREIAEATGMALGTVKTHLYRAIDSVKAALKVAPKESAR